MVDPRRNRVVGGAGDRDLAAHVVERDVARARLAPPQHGRGSRQFSRVLGSRARYLKSIVWQDWTTVAGDGAGTQITQDSGLWLDLLRHLGIKVKLELLYVDAATTQLKFETSNSPDGPWTEVSEDTEFSVANTYVLTMSSESEAERYPIRRYLRWTATGSASDWSICFYLTWEPMTIS